MIFYIRFTKEEKMKDEYQRWLYWFEIYHNLIENEFQSINKIETCTVSYAIIDNFVTHCFYNFSFHHWIGFLKNDK